MNAVIAPFGAFLSFFALFFFGDFEDPPPEPRCGVRVWDAQKGLRVTERCSDSLKRFNLEPRECRALSVDFLNTRHSPRVCECVRLPTQDANRTAGPSRRVWLGITAIVPCIVEAGHSTCNPPAFCLHPFWLMCFQMRSQISSWISSARHHRCPRPYLSLSSTPRQIHLVHQERSLRHPHFPRRRPEKQTKDTKVG